MNYENYLARWRNLSSVLLDIATVTAAGDDRYLKATRSKKSIYPALIVAEPTLTYNSIDSREWHCEVALVSKHKETHDSQDATLQDTFRIISNIIYLANTPTEIGFAHSHEVTGARIESISTSADDAIGWKLTFKLIDHSPLCLNMDIALETPASPDHIYIDDAAAKAAGLIAPAIYYLADNNLYGMPGGIPKRIME
jgi:hypothetical protein